MQKIMGKKIFTIYAEKNCLSKPMGLKDFQLCNIEVLQSRSVSQLCIHAIISIHVGCTIMFQLYIYVNYRYSLPN